MLIGQYNSKLTDKKRLSVPKKFRAELGDELVIARWYEGCLVLVSRESWHKLIKRLVGEIKIITSPVRDIDRFVLGSAFEVELDSQGRFVLLDTLLDYAQIGEEVVFVGLGDRVEVWSDKNWQEFEVGAEAKAAKAIERIASTSSQK